jgi:prophage DNA circulation protein
VSFLDRLRELRYISPSGVEHKPLFDETQRTGGKKAPVHELPQRDVADVQDLGNQAEHFSMMLYFVGPDYDTAADAFYAALREKGIAILKHPRWGDREVLPLTHSQTEKFVDDIRCARFQVDFVEAPSGRAISVTTVTPAAIQSAAASISSTIAEKVSQGMVAGDAIQKAKMKGSVMDQLSGAMDQLKAMTAAVDDVRTQIVAAGNEVERNIDTLVDTPLELAESVIAILRMPAQIETSIIAKVRGYGEHIAETIASLVDLVPCQDAASAVDLMGSTVALAESTTAGTFLSRSEAIDAYNSMTDSASVAFPAIEGLTDSVQYLEILSLLRQLIADAQARLLEESYSLPTERRMVLAGDSNPISLAFQLYGDPERYNDVINENHLSSPQIFVIPRGTEIRWYE